MKRFRRFLSRLIFGAPARQSTWRNYRHRENTRRAEYGVPHPNAAMNLVAEIDEVIAKENHG